jgi:FG-GAP-like repeat
MIHTKFLRMLACALGVIGVLRAEEPTPEKKIQLVMEEVTNKSGITRIRAPIKNDGADATAMKEGQDYFDWPFDVFCGDIDGDGHADLFSTDHHASATNRTPGGIWLGNGDGTFAPNVLLRSQIENPAKPGSFEGIGAAWGAVVDVDGDGRSDFICSGTHGAYLNKGTEGSGPTRTLKLSLVKCGGTRSWSFNDYNRDGNLDVAWGMGSNVLFGGGKGTHPAQWKISAQAAAELRKFEDPLHHCVSADFRRTGSADILGGQSVWRWAWGGDKKPDRKEPRGVLLLNDGKGNFTDSAATFGLAEMSSTGPLVAADFDNDGFFDIFSVGLGNPDKPAKARLFFNEAGKKFALADTAQAGIDIKLNSVGGGSQYCCASAADLDNDGWLDLVVGDGANYKVRVFQNLGGRKFQEVELKSKVHGHQVRFAVADFNEDGLPDMAVNGGTAGVQVFLNRSTSPHGSIDVAVKGTAGNPSGIGALVEVFREGDPKTYVGMQHVVAENNNHVPLAPHFGLGNAARVDIRVTLPTGEVLEAKAVSSRTRVLADFQAGKIEAQK